MLKIFGAALLGIVGVVSSANAAERYIVCDNPPARVWNTYYCVSATVDTVALTMKDVEFGTCSGSTEAMETEPVDIEQLDTASINESMRATSSQWKNAHPFDMTNPTFGPSTLYIQPGFFGPESSKFSTARIKVTKNASGAGTDVKVYCH